MLSVVLLGRDLVNRERGDSAKEILYKELTKVEIALKLNARSRLDALLSVSVNPGVRRLLLSASVGGDIRAKARGDLLRALRKRNKAMGKYAADLLIALDMKGKVICQVGKNESEYGYKLSGFPSVDAALRGFLRDDVWKINNDVYVVATRPVIEQARYVGVLVHAVKVSNKLVTALNPSVQFAFFSGNMIVALGGSTGDSALRAQGANIAEPLDRVLSSKKYLAEGYSDVQTITTQDGEFLSVYAAIKGEAAKNNVGFALVMPIAFMGSPTEFFDLAGTQDIDALPIGWIIVLGLFIIIVGLGGIYLEGERPVSKLLKSISALEEADPKDQLNIYLYRRKIRKIAAAVNSLVDYKIRHLLEDEVTGTKRNIDSILGVKNGARLSAASFKFTEPSTADIPSVPPTENLPPPPIKGDPGAPTPPTGAKVKKQSPEEEQRYFNTIYEQFVALKKQLGEPTEQLTFERFLGTIQKNRDTLIARYKCEQVQFQVYEKGGKASLKAIPVKS
jgi:hypothetical protein